MSVTIVELKTNENQRRYAAVFVPADRALHLGVPAGAVIGWLDTLEPTIVPEAFQPNAEFKIRLQSVVEEFGPMCQRLQDEARKIKFGVIYVIDLRTENLAGSVPSEDIIGAFEVSGGIVEPMSYQANPNYEILTYRGFFSLDAFLEEKLLEICLRQ